MMKTRTKLWLTALSLAMLAVILWFAAQRYMAHVLASTDVGVNPFIATISHYASDGSISANETMARARSGAMVHIYSTKTYEGMRTIDLPDGFRGMIADSVGIKSTGYRSSAEIAARKHAMLNPSPHCAEPGANSLEKFIRQESLFGQSADVIQVEQGPRRQTAWRLPAYSCQTVAMTFEDKDANGNWHTRASTRLDSFQARDPDPSFFTGFATYREMPPSQLIHEHVKAATGQTMPATKNDAALDKAYANSR